ncbi:hypothetical protein AB0D42_29640 [Streptomyces sp. NPDC048304]|uniref:hypothetical protein n=1 Tax=Streptomyces sp. NPDC048304 TaxID=3154820 RepID=UPI0033DB47CB
MSETEYVRGDATVPSVKGGSGTVRRLAVYGQGRGELRDQPRTARRSPLLGGPTASVPARPAERAVTVYDHEEGGG